MLYPDLSLPYQRFSWVLQHAPKHVGMKHSRFHRPIPIGELQTIRLLTRILNEMENKLMPKKARFQAYGGGDIKFAPVRLTPDDRDTFHTWQLAQTERVWDMLAELAEGGWKCSFGEDLQNACYIASHTCHDESNPNFHTCVSSRSDDIAEALLLNCYKIGVMYHDKKIPTEREDANWG